MNRRRWFGVSIALLASLTYTTARAQWSIGAPGPRVAPAGQHRYAFLVFANPIPGREVEFNEWYTTVHIGDLVQLPGWVGAQRFRIVSNVTPKPSVEGYRHGYLIVWEIEDADVNAATTRMIDAIGEGKIRRGAAFDYSPGVAGAGMYEAISARMARADGTGPSIPDRNDPRAPRLNRYMLMELANPAAGGEQAFEGAVTQRIKDVLTLPGWLGAQRFRLAEGARVGGRPGKPRFLTVWEIQAESAQRAHDVLQEATKAGRVKPVTIDEKSAEMVYWEPITPYVTREAFER